MKATEHPRNLGLAQRMLVVDPHGHRVADARVGDLIRMLGPGDVVVVNDAATVPGSIAVTAPSGRRHELRLVTRLREGRWCAVLMGEGDWREDTDGRPPPDALGVGAALHARSGAFRIHAVDARSPRLVTVDFVPPAGVSPLEWLYDVARPIQYSYASRPCATREVQGPFAARPWAVEMPSAGRPLRVSLILKLRAAGVEVRR
ncbi:MAG: S-adenosylmethionine:tRNA ribosyltransferase-isomerase, partial [Myxococcota bacterium]